MVFYRIMERLNAYQGAQKSFEIDECRIIWHAHIVQGIVSILFLNRKILL